ncbi:hypothetical protein [Bacillus sp. Marseille-P3661]|uniref:hypothetical protein n=1 Tax=Bacillus sp. Marseille-P3661 TaxID=1936234 RepID=UPI000C82B1D6|nr:hypothetical protein [Bacillus sp. Marseille-P3661]
MNKLVVLIIALIILVTTACGQQEPREIELKEYTITELTESDLKAVDKITIKNGETGDVKTIEDQQDVTAWLDFIKGIQFTPDLDQNQREGWLYMITLYEGNRKVLEFYPNYIDDIYFKVENDVISKFDELFKS